MNATQFIKDHGLERAREVVEGIPSKYMECYYSTLCYCTKAKKYSDRFNPRIELVNMADLKRLVESVDLINYRGGLEEAKDYADFCLFKGREERGNRIKQAIKDYESIYGEGNER